MQNKLYFNLALFNNSKYLISFDIARCTALLLILFMHIEAGFNSYTGNSFINFLYVGPLGVPIFFFISGFLIFKSLNENPNSNFLNFTYKRVLRLIPLHHILLIIYVISLLIFSESLNNFQEISSSKIISSLFFGFGRFEKTYLSAGWALWPEFVFYSFTGLLLVEAPKDKFKSIFSGFALIFSSLLFPGGGLLRTSGIGGIEAIKPWSEGGSTIGILLTCLGNLICFLGISIFVQSFSNFISLSMKKNRFLLVKEYFTIFLTFILSSYFYSKGSYYFYFSSGAFLLLCFKKKNFLFLFIHYLILGLISLFSYRANNISLIIYFTFLFIPLLETLISRFNPFIKKTIRNLSKISYTIYLVQIFTIPIYFKISSYLWKDNILYWPSIINCLLFTIILSYFIWYILEKPLNKLFFG